MEALQSLKSLMPPRHVAQSTEHSTDALGGTCGIVSVSPLLLHQRYIQEEQLQHEGDARVIVMMCLIDCDPSDLWHQTTFWAHH